MMTSSIGGIGGGISASTLKQMQEQMFKTADTNGDSSISKDELSQISKSGTKQNSTSVDEMFSQLDSDSNGAISRLESDAAIAKAGQGMEAQGPPPQGPPPPPPSEDAAADTSQSSSDATALYDAMDTNEDGIVSPSELAAALEEAQESSASAADPRTLMDNLGNALQSGNISDAQSALSALQKDVSSHNGGQGNDPFTKDLQSLSDALESGDLSGAQSIFAGIQEKLSAGPPDKPGGANMQSGDSESADTVTKTLQVLLDALDKSSSSSDESSSDNLKSILTSALSSYLSQSSNESTQDSAISASA